jgi:hypothetical protein
MYRGADYAGELLLLVFLRQTVYPTDMDRGKGDRARPDIAAATRGDDDSVGMDGEADPATASLQEALYWRDVYTEILTMEESVLERIHQLMAGQSPQARREVELTNVPVVAAQAARFRARLGFWESCVEARQTSHAGAAG